MVLVIIVIIISDKVAHNVTRLNVHHAVEHQQKMPLLAMMENAINVINMDAIHVIQVDAYLV